MDSEYLSSSKYVFYFSFFVQRLKMAAHESPTGSQQSSGEGEGESTPEEGADAHHDTGTPETPMSLSDLLGYAFFLILLN